MSSVFKALSDPTRRKVLQLLRAGAMTAGELAGHFEVSKPTMSVHFKVLREADLIHAEKHGKSITYSLKMSVLEEALMGFAQAFDLEVRRDDRSDNRSDDSNDDSNDDSDDDPEERKP